MKKMQCEVCGSTEIKRIDDSTFECQSCGVQYSKNELQKLLVEITGNVKVDHSQEVENTIKRAEQFENDGDSQKAKEYYNKALDMDAENEKAQQRIKEIEDNQELENYYIVDSAVDPKENVELFLKQLATTKNIACDIYKHIKIDSVIEKYVTAMYVSVKNEYKWNAIACNRYYENQTVYKEKYDAQLKKYVKEPVTKQIEKISRTPINGTDIFNNNGFALASNSVQKEFLTNNELIEEMVRDFEQLQKEKHDANKCIALDSGKIVRNDNGIYKYNNITVDMDFDQSIYIKKYENILSNCDSKAEMTIRSSMRADFVENYNWSRCVISKKVYKILIPVQVINFSYKGEKYVAVSDLISNKTSMPMIYPCDSELAEKKETLTQDNSFAKKTPKSVIWGCLLGAAGFLFMLICGMILMLEDEITLGVTFTFWGAGIILMIIGMVQKIMRKKKFEYDNQKFKTELYNPRKKYLSESYKLFFDSYSVECNLDEIQNSIPDNIINIVFNAKVSCSDEIKDFSCLHDNDLDKDANEIIVKKASIKKATVKVWIGILIMVVGTILSFGFISVLGIEVFDSEELGWGVGFICAVISFVCGFFVQFKANKEKGKLCEELKELSESWIEE